MSEWKPIESAPKDGSCIVGIWPYGSRWASAVVWFDSSYEEWIDVHSDNFKYPRLWISMPPPHTDRGCK